MARSDERQQYREQSAAERKSSLWGRLGPKQKKWLAAGVGAVLVMGIQDVLQDHTSILDSNLKAGADTQVLAHRHVARQRWSGRSIGYELILRQCAEDVAAAQNGVPHQRSFNSPTAVCTVDAYGVDPDTYKTVHDGDVFPLPGDPGEKMVKTIRFAMIDSLVYPIGDYPQPFTPPAQPN